MFHFDEFQVLECICYVLAAGIVILLERECHTYKQSLVTASVYTTVSVQPGTSLAPVEAVVDGVFPFLEEATAKATAIVSKSLYQPTEPPALSTLPTLVASPTESVGEAAPLEPVEVISCQRFVDQAVAACESSNTASAEEETHLSEDKPTISIAGLTLYKLHDKSVLKISDLTFDVPAGIKRYSYRKVPKSVIRLEDLEKVFTVTT